jgi:hypothetical protein
VLVDGVECFEEILVGDHAKGRESGEVGSGSLKYLLRRRDTSSTAK